MKKIAIIATLGAIITVNAFSNELSAPQETEVVAVIKIHRSLEVIKDGSQNIANIYKVSNLLRLSDDPYNSDELKSLEELVPAANFIVNNYDKKIVPILLNQAMDSNDIYFKRRAIYCIERISDASIEKVLTDQFGDNLDNDKLQKLVENTTLPKQEVSWYFPPFGSEYDDLLKGLKKE